MTLEQNQLQALPDGICHHKTLGSLIVHTNQLGEGGLSKYGLSKYGLGKYGLSKYCRSKQSAQDTWAR